jgi:hypothetical protein
MELDVARQALDSEYEIIRELGRGGMGVVFLAHDRKLDRPVALKVLPPDLAADGALKERFLREARTAARLAHPNIVPVYRADETRGLAWFAMGFVEGESLRQRVEARGTLPPAESVRILRETAWALAYAHARGVVHRDVKPDNILVDRDGRIVVTDFGIARDLKATSLTSSGMVMGTVHYMSPEQATDEALDGRSDLYGLGVVGFWMLSGRLPFEEQNAAALLVAHATRPAPLLADVAPGVPAALAAVIDRCLAKAPNDRWPTGEALAEALGLALANPEISGERGAAKLTTGEAEAVWRRAAELQAEAAARLELRARDGTGSLLPATIPSGGYKVADVEAAAREAGIGGEFVALAIAERPAAAGTPLAVSDRDDRLYTRFLGVKERGLVVSRRIVAPARRVLEATGRVFTDRPYHLTLSDTVGGHPLSGGVLVFAIEKLWSGKVDGTMMLSSFWSRMYQLEVWRLSVTLEQKGNAVELTVHADLREGMRKNLTVDGWITGVAASSGAAVGGAVGIAALGVGAVAALPALLGGAMLAGTALASYRWMYRRALRLGTQELAGLLEAVERHLRTADVFTAPRGPGE